MATANRRVQCSFSHGNDNTSARRFAAPWRSEKISGGYVVRDANGQALAYVYARATMAEAMQAKTLTQDEARRIAANIARLPALLISGQTRQG
jgi:hypothetical protein